MKDTEKVALASNLYECWKKILPDSRLSRIRRTIWTPFGEGQLLFCPSCGRSSGACFGDVSHAVFICDDCVTTHGHVPLPQIPDELIRGNPGD